MESILPPSDYEDMEIGMEEPDIMAGNMTLGMEEPDIMAGNMTPLTTKNFGEVVEFLRITNDIAVPPKALPKSSTESFAEFVGETFTQEMLLFNLPPAPMLKRILREIDYPHGHDQDRLCLFPSNSTTSLSLVLQVP